MAVEQSEESLTPGNDEEVQQPTEIADELSKTEANPVDLPPAPREEQIQNAITFLAHPKVRSSSKDSKTSFLKRKGLTKNEIDEAFKRVPESSVAPAVSTLAQPVAPGQSFSSNQGLRPVLYTTQQQAPPPSQSYRWSQVIIGASVLVAGAYALKELVGPYAVGWYRKLYGVPQPAEDSTEKQTQEKKLAELLAGAISSQNFELRETVDSLKEVVIRLEKGKQVASPSSEGGGLSVSDLREELHAFAATIAGVNPKADGNSEEVSEQLKQLKELLAERLPSAPRVAPKAVAYKHPHTTDRIANGVQSVAPPAARFAHSRQTEPSTASSEIPDPSQTLSYQEVLDILDRGETPPNVRTDIDDNAPNPTASPPKARMQPRPKPWERSHAAGPNGLGASDAEAREPASSGVTITELEESPPSKKSSSGAWKPPPVPQASLKVGDNDAEGAQATE